MILPGRIGLTFVKEPDGTVRLRASWDDAALPATTSLLQEMDGSPEPLRLLVNSAGEPVCLKVPDLAQFGGLFGRAIGLMSNAVPEEPYEFDLPYQDLEAMNDKVRVLAEDLILDWREMQNDESPHPQ